MLKNVSLFIAFSLVVVMLLMGVATVANAAPNPKNCKFKGTVNSYALAGQPITLDFSHNSNTFRESVCNLGRTKIFKSVGNTRREKRYLRLWAKTVSTRNSPTAICYTKKRAKLYDYAPTYFANLKYKVRDQNKFNRWTKKVARRDNCRAFR